MNAITDAVSTHEHLLDVIARKLGCSMLSNMQAPCWQAFVRLALPPVEQINQYSLTEWNETAQYIFSAGDFDTSEAAYTAISVSSSRRCEEIKDCLITMK